MKQTPPRTHKEALQDMGRKLSDLRGLVSNLATHELPALSQALAGSSPEVVKLLEEIAITAAAMEEDLQELDDLRREPFRATA